MAVLVFFQVTKHQPRLAPVNPFAEDPYDSVSSFGVQFLVFIALLSVIRASCFCPSSLAMEARTMVVNRGMLMGVMAALTISLSNGVALARHVGMWREVPGGDELVLLSAGLLTITLVAGAVLYLPLQSRKQSLEGRQWSRVLGGLCAAGLTLAFYPERLRTSLWGELMTVLTGAVLLFLPVWALATALSPSKERIEEDLIADLAALYAACKIYLPVFEPVWRRLEGVFALSGIAWLIDLLNPRRHRWNIVVAIGVLVGGAFVAAEMIVDGPPSSWAKLGTLTAVFIGLQMAGVAFGYSLLSRPLHLVRERP